MKIIDEKYIISNYTKGLSLGKLTLKYHVHTETIKKVLLKYNIKIRTRKEAIKLSFIIYPNLRIEKRQLMKMGFCKPKLKHTEESKYKMRQSHKNKVLTNDHRIKISEGMRKVKLHSYIDGRTDLHHKLYNIIEYKLWRESIFKRDNHTCQDCGLIGCRLESHHKTPFAKLLKEFLKEYNQFSPIEDKETLIGLAIKYKPFWDIDNGITLCKDCHKNITAKK